ncbi:hypothetical protein [Neobacillus sp. CF12]|uniref:hypothetical protein n=1 Tax=Neobacillus sp. CF12 TaxID=3055864 RepID=UPI0025A03649|nr:hypothetical protein [Neobacillus sp. CF12]MDM5326805.1 hypothetical protein [Neobacillus sp. CF12]
MDCEKTIGECKTLYDLVTSAQADWQTKHAASCEGGVHSADCTNAYQNYQTKLNEWSAKCCK